MWRPTFVLWQLPFFHTYQTRLSKGLWGWIRMVSMKLPTTEVLAEVLENLAAGFPWWDHGSLSQKEIRDKMTCRFVLDLQTLKNQPPTWIQNSIPSWCFNRGVKYRIFFFFSQRRGQGIISHFPFIHSFILCLCPSVSFLLLQSVCDIL